MKGLKIITSVLLLAVICTASESEEEIIKELEKYESECLEEFELSKNDAEDHLRMICSGEELDKKLSCYMACFHKKIGALKDGEIEVDGVKDSILPLIKDETVKNELMNKLDTCKAEVSTISDDCDKVTEYTKCMIKGTEFCKHVLE
ncbi:hypothetical protein M0802_016365 [Mischocyttarus mexicanus]|nr:hypothetical protein M0802_016365 [Mischocyttarus mexicanus]